MYSNPDQKKKFDQSKAFLKQEISIDQIDILRDLLRFHEWKYYVNNNPVLADFEYDSLYKKLEELEAKFPEQIHPDSPTQRVGKDITTDYKKVKHLTPMLSLGNSYNEEDLIDFDTRIKKLLKTEDKIQYAVEPKFDGGSMALVYEDDKLIRAATRGDGTQGEEMTLNARSMKTVPLSASFSKYGIYKAELRGEAVIRKDRFAKVNEAREEEGLEVFANPRNAATGGLRTKNPQETANRQIDLFVFQLSWAENAQGEDILDNLVSHAQSIDMLRDLGFKVPANEFGVYDDISGVIKHTESWAAKRDSYPYEIDGMVIKVNDYNQQNELGLTQHHPRWAIAFKFKAKQATSKLIHVDFQVGKIGSITPVAKIEPVALAGVTVSSISLHNEDFINSKDIRLGDTVLVERAGDVIPYIVKPLEELRDGTEVKIEFPTHCPSCNTLLVKEEGESAWRCPNYYCKAQVIQRLIHHVSKDAMNIDGFGKSYVERFYELGWLKDPSDIYNLDYQAISELEGFGDRSASKLEKSIEAAKSNSLARILYSMSIYHLGRKASKVLAQKINHALDLKDWVEEDFTSIHDVGPILAREVMKYFSNQEHLDLLARMEERGVDLHQKEEDKPLIIAEDAPFAGKTILFTGSLQMMTRKEAQEKAEKAGAKNLSSVSSKLDILVVGEKAGSKLKKAEALGTVVIYTEEDFLALLDEKSS